MTPAKLTIAMQGQTGIAKKVFECVPAQESWTEAQVIGALMAMTGSTPDARIVRGCLRDLADSGLIRKTDSSHWQRVRVKTKQDKEPEMASEKKAQVDPIEILGGLATEVAALACEFESQLKRIATRIDDAALAIAQDRDSSADAAEKLRQLQALLKGL